MLLQAIPSALRLRFAQLRLAHGGLVFAGLMLMLPFLFWEHQLPITTFYQEWGAAFLGFCALLCMFLGSSWRGLQVPRIVLLPLGVALLVSLQLTLGMLENAGQALMALFFMLYALMMMVLGFRLREEFGMANLTVVLAVFLLAGAELNALAGVAQHYSWRNFIFDKFVTIKINSPVYGNLGQPNHYADYISLGLVSLGLLFMHWRLRVWQVLLLAAPLLFVLTLSGSRGTWLYILLLAAMSFLWQRRDGSAKRLFYYSISMLAGLGLMGFVVQIPWLANGYLGTNTISNRIMEEVASGKSSSGGLRLYLLREAWLIFTQHPLWGAGFGQFGWQHFMLGPVLRDIRIHGLYTTPHNLLAQVAAEMGMAGLAVLGGTLVLWFRQARSLGRSIYTWWGWGVLGVLGTHSLLEYPLAYAFFMGVAALALGMMDNTTFSIGKHWLGRLSLAMALLVSGGVLWQLWDGYHKLEKVDPFVYPGEQYSYHRRINYQRLLKLQGVQYLMFQPRVEFMMGETAWDHVADEGKLNRRVLHSLPVGSAAYREVNLLARFGHQEEARKVLEQAIWAFPEEFPVEVEKLQSLSKMDTDPVRYPALLEFALRVNGKRKDEIAAASLMGIRE